MKTNAAFLLLLGSLAWGCSSGDTRDAAGALSTAPSATVPDAPDQGGASIQSYGQTQWVTAGTTIPSGWVIISRNLNQLLIKDLNGAPYGAKLWVSSGSAIPTGWVILSLNGSSAFYIENLNGAPAGTQVWIYGGSTVPAGWVIISQNGSMLLIKKL
jgi:uncharacterized protein YbdZ (MbtH family)